MMVHLASVVNTAINSAQAIRESEKMKPNSTGPPSSSDTGGSSSPNFPQSASGFKYLEVNGQAGDTSSYSSAPSPENSNSPVTSIRFGLHSVNCKIIASTLD